MSTFEEVFECECGSVYADIEVAIDCHNNQIARWFRCLNCHRDHEHSAAAEACDCRAAELAELEREIGRAVIAEEIANHAAGHVASSELASWRLYKIGSDALNETDALIARWRQLHAAGAEGRS